MGRNGSSGLLAVLALLFASCRESGPRIDFVALDGSLEPLRSAFNADSGKVRAILLGSPT